MARSGNTVQISVSLSKQLIERLKVIAENEKRSLSNLIRVLLEDSVNLEKTD